jgi:mono/diheme cytochrome c family protein
MSSRLRTRLILAAALLVGAVLYAGPRGRPFARPPLHVNPNMDVQPRAEAQSGSAFFYDGASMRRPVAGTIARGELRDTSPEWTGFDAMGDFVPTIPIALDDALRERGRHRYDIYCAACHDKNGDGKGILLERGKVPTPTFHQDRLRQVPDGYFFGVITNGFGMMPSYAYPVPPADRWAIIAHVRELQARRASASPGVTTAPPPAEPATPGATN